MQTFDFIIMACITLFEIHSMKTKSEIFIQFGWVPLFIPAIHADWVVGGFFFRDGVGSATSL